MREKEAERVYLVYKAIIDMKWELAQVRSNMQVMSDREGELMRDIDKKCTELEAI